MGKPQGKEVTKNGGFAITVSLEREGSGCYQVCYHSKITASFYCCNKSTCTLSDEFCLVPFCFECRSSFLLPYLYGDFS